MFIQAYLPRKIPLIGSLRRRVKHMSKQAVTEADRSIGRRIQKRRKELQITAAELSEKLDISQQQLSRYERGTNKINVAHLVNIAVYLDAPIGWFFLECKADLRSAIGDNKSRYVVQQDEDLRIRLGQCWTSLTPDQRRALIAFLDTLDAPELS